jgi:hypothetical protein
MPCFIGGGGGVAAWREVSPACLGLQEDSPGEAKPARQHPMQGARFWWLAR